MEVVCSQCQALLEAPEEMAGQIVICPQCGASNTVPVPASAQVIEVHAESIGDDAEEAVRYEEDPFFNPEAQHPAQGDQVWGRSVRIENINTDGRGCCASGCIAILVVFFFFIYGIVSFFS